MAALDQWINSAGEGGNRNSMQYLLSSGTQTSFEFNFTGGYINAADTKAYIYHTATGLTTDINPVVLTGPNTIEVVPAVPAGDYLVVYRDTQKTVPLVDFVSGAILDEVNLDTIAKQAVFNAAEMVDRFSQIKTNSDDAIARSYTALTTANAASDSAAAAVTASSAAVSTANTASTQAAAAVTTANAANSTANGIDAKASTALSNSAAAVTTANAANSTANGIDAKASTALSNSAAAVTTANSASSTANAASTTANGIDAKATQAQTDAAAALATANQAATDFAGTTDPATIPANNVVAYMTWADTGSKLLKRRNPGNTAWDVESLLSRRFAPGETLQTVFFTFSLAATNVTASLPLHSTPAIITPKSANSVIEIDFHFKCQLDESYSGNALFFFVVNEVTAGVAAAIPEDYIQSAIIGSTAVTLVSMVRARGFVQNASLSPRSFKLYGRIGATSTMMHGGLCTVSLREIQA